MEWFDLNRESTILIYGAGAFGQNIYRQIKNRYNVQGFIDKRKVSLNIDGEGSIPVFQINDLIDLHQCVVIICVHNAAWHYEIAEDLYAAGFSKILFLAVKNTYNRSMARHMNEIYSYLLENHYEYLKQIPCYETLRETCDSEDIIRKNKEYVVTFCRRELIFSRKGIEEHNKKNNITDENWFYDDCPLAAYEIYLSLMKYYMYGQNSPDMFLTLQKDFINSFEMSDAEFLDDQWSVYQLLECEYEKGLDSFQYAPIDVVWNKKGYFNIIDGHHRAAFYYMKGVHNFPVRMKQEDYECWINTDKVKEVRNALKTFIPPIPLMHPFFSKIEYTLHEYEESSVEMVLSYVYRNKKEYESLLDASDFGGEFARSFYRTGKAAQIVSLTTKDAYEFQNALNELHYVPSDYVRLRSGSIENLDEHFQCGIICGKYNQKELKKIGVFLDMLISDEIIWQSKENIEKEKEYILHSTKFKQYEILGRKCVNGKLREIGVFRKNMIKNG